MKKEIKRQRIPYAEKLLDPRWQRKRLEIFERDGWECSACGTKTKTLHVHHEYYRKNIEPWDYPDYAYTTLCSECHADVGVGSCDRFVDALLEVGLTPSTMACMALCVGKSKAKINQRDLSFAIGLFFMNTRIRNLIIKEVENWFQAREAKKLPFFPDEDNEVTYYG